MQSHRIEALVRFAAKTDAELPPSAGGPFAPAGGRTNCRPLHDPADNGRNVPKGDLPTLTQKTVPEPEWSPSTNPATIGPRSVSRVSQGAVRSMAFSD
jgi:hypothetical protein